MFFVAVIHVISTDFEVIKDVVDVLEALKDTSAARARDVRVATVR